MDATHGRPGRQGVNPAFPRLLGERRCLDFANTVEPRTGPDSDDYLQSYADLVRWGEHAGTLAKADVRRLLAEGERRPGEAAATLGRALALREAIYRTFRALAHGEPPAERDLAAVYEEYLTALAHARLAEVGERFAVAWRDDESGLDRVLWPVARSAVELLLGGDPARVKQCAGPDGGCGWLFYDESKNGSRRWCSMEGCGSQAKMRRYRARRRPSHA